MLTTLGEIWLKETELRTIAVEVRLVEEHQVDVVGLQFAQTLVDALHGLSVSIVGRPDLGNEENLIVVILSCYIPHRSQPPATRWRCSRQVFKGEVGKYALLYLRCFAILAWSLPCLSLEKADEVLRIFKAEALADLRNA